MSTKHESIRTYTIGFILSVALTLAAFFVVVQYMNSALPALTSEIIIALVIGLAIVQMFVQFWFFLHLGQEKGPRWNLLFLISTVSIILLVVVGSLWIMSHLNYNHMTPQETESHLIEKEGIHKE